MGSNNINLLKSGYLLHWYRIKTVLGQGGFGITYLAEDQNLQETVAIKEYFTSQFASRSGNGSVQLQPGSHAEDYQWGLDRFITEARTLSQFRHPCIVRVRNVFEANNTAYMVMDFEEGITLGDKLKGKKTLPEAELLTLFLPLLEGLEMIHEAGFIHRDIKPDNIIVQNKRAVLIDFGAARQAAGERSISLTQIVSAGYAPFEQYHSKGEHQGPWTDVYAMGATLYRAVTGIAPSQAIDRSNALLETSRDTYVSARELCGDRYSESFLQAIDHALAFQTAKRPQTVSQWRAEIKGDDKALTESEAPTGIMEKETGQWSQAERTQIKQQLARLLASETFATAEQLQRLLKYLVEEALEGRGDRINQTSIAIDVLGKDEHFDPSVDSLVRSEARRLRSRLMEYHYGEGRDDPIRFDLPKGHYIPTIIFMPEPVQKGLTVAVNSIKSVSYKIRRTSRSNLSKVYKSPALIYSFLGLLILVLLIVVFTEERIPKEDQDSVDTAIKKGTVEVAKPDVIQNRKSIAVLPFANYSAPEEEADFFVFGLHDDLLTQLTRIRDMKVISRTSVMHYQDTTKPASQIADELNVAMIMAGSVQRSGDRFRINVRLIDAATDEYLWAESFEKEFTTTNIFEFQRNIALKAAASLQSTVTPKEQQRIAVVPTDSLEAYQAYLIGKQHMAKRTREALAKAETYFQKAIALDTDFTLAYLGLADCYLIQSGEVLPRPVELLKKAENAINKALDLDGTLGEAYASLGLLRQLRGDLDGADAAYLEALSLKPNYATTYHWYGLHLKFQERDKEALVLFRKGAELDPFSAIIQINIAYLLEKLNFIDEAMRQYEKVIKIDPEFSHAYKRLGQNYVGVYGQADKGMEYAIKAFNLNPSSDVAAEISYLYGSLGDSLLEECWIKLASDLNPDDFRSLSGFADYYLSHGEEDRALELFEIVAKEYPKVVEVLIPLSQHDTGRGRYDEARARYVETHPELVSGKEPEINSYNVFIAIDLAYVLQHTGETQQAELLLDRAFKYMALSPRYGILDTYVYALQGKFAEALASLRKAVIDDKHAIWISDIDDQPYLAALRLVPQYRDEYLAIKAKAEAVNTRQLENIREMKRRGELLTDFSCQ